MSSAAAVPSILPAATADLADQFSMLPNEALDLEILDAYELSTFIHLWRLTRGFHVFSKRVSIERLCSRTKIGRTKLKEVLHSLEDKKLIAIEETQGRSNLYTVWAPREVEGYSKPVAVERPDTAEIAEEPVQPQVNHMAAGGGRSATSLKETDLKEEIDITPTTGGVDDGPIIPLKDVIDGAGFASPLAGLTQGALDLAYKMAPAWTVLRVLITLLVGYLYKVDAIINPLALIKYALKSKDFVKLEDKDIVSEFLKKIRYFIGHIPQNEHKYFISELNEIRAFENWLEIHHEITLKDLYYEYHRQCQITSKKWSFLWFFIVTDPSKEKRKK